METALRCGIGVAEFWDQTPRETVAAIEGAAWRMEREQEQSISGAWLTAALMRSKKMPSLKRVLNTKPAKPLKGEELKRRRQEFADMKKSIDLSKLNEALRKKR